MQDFSSNQPNKDQAVSPSGDPEKEPGGFQSNKIDCPGNGSALGRCRVCGWNKEKKVWIQCPALPIPKNK